MLHRKKAQTPENIIENISKPIPEVKPPKSVKPLSKKHFQPIMEEVKSMRPIIDEVNKNLSEMKTILEEMKKIVGNPQSNEPSIKTETTETI